MYEQKESQDDFDSEYIEVDGSLMINMAFMPLYMWEMWDVTPVTDGHSDGRTVESSAVFSLSWIRNFFAFTHSDQYA